MKMLFVLFSLMVSLFAKVDYSVMSTEELLAMMGYVPAKNEKAFKVELGKRVDMMSKKEKRVYIKNLKKSRK